MYECEGSKVNIHCYCCVCSSPGELSFVRLTEMETFTIPTGDDTFSSEILTDGGFKFGNTSVDSVYVRSVFVYLRILMML